jgi:hypothetical protein
MARLDVVFATLGTKQSEQVAAESNRVLRELGDKLNALDGQESARIAAESNKIVGEISRQLAALGSSYADGNAALERRFDSVEGGIASAATEYAESSAALKALRESMESNTESGQKLRAESAAKLAESEFANGRRDRAILLATCAATADPTNPRLAIRLSEMAAQGPDPQPESLDSTVMLLRTLALQSTGEGATQIWDAADRLNEQSQALASREADEESHRLNQEAAELAGLDCARAKELAAMNYGSLHASERESRLTELAALVIRLDAPCLVERPEYVRVLERWQRAQECVAAVTAMQRALDSIDVELRGGRGSGELAMGQLNLVERLSAAIYTTSESEIGAASWAGATRELARFKRTAESVFEARDVPVLAELSELVGNAVVQAEGASDRVSNGAGEATGEAERAIKALAERTIEAAQLIGKLVAVSSQRTSRDQVDRLRRAMESLKKTQYEKYTAWARSCIERGMTLFENETVVSAADASRIAPTITSIDYANLPSALAGAYHWLWSRLEGEAKPLSSLLKARIDAVKVTPANF